MNFATPAWLLLLPALLVLAWQWPRLELRRPLRMLCLLLLVLGLADLRWKLFEPGLDLWVLVDRSDSADDLLAPRLHEWEGLLTQSMGHNDKIKFIDFGDDAVVRPEDLSTASEVNTTQTRIANALRLAVLRHDPKRATRLLLLSDGYATEPMGEVGELLNRAELPLDMRLVALGGGTDFVLDSLQAPNRVKTDEPFVIDMHVRVDGAANTTVPYQLERDGVVVTKGEATVQNGQARVRFTDHIIKGGSVHYTARLLPQNDPVPGNNFAETWVQAMAGAHVLIISAYPDDPVAAALQAQGIDVDLETNPKTLHPGRLSGTRAVIINNVPASDLSVDFMKAVDFYVREQGGGLLMLGGKNSFGSGGYFASKLDDLLPVSMEIRDEKRKLTVAMAIVLDRSGSMSASVPTSSGTRQKIELADAGTAEAIRLLGPRDMVSVFAVDTRPYAVVPLAKVEPGRNEMIDNVLKIASQGGGICVPTGLRAAWEELKKTDLPQKHIILFADANDATQETVGMESIVKEIADANATISVIGLGHDTDRCAYFLQDVAARGNGRIFFSSDANDLPAIFTQDTVAVARSSYITDPTALLSTASWVELASRTLDWPKAIDAYNLCYIKDKATQAALSVDENNAPLVAFWQRGTGRAAAVTFPLSGPHTDLVHGWPAFGDFVTTLTRWLMGNDSPDGLGVKARLNGDEMTLDLFYDGPGWETEIAKNFPKAVFTQNGVDSRRDVNWERLEPGHFAAHVRLEAGQPAIGAVQVGQYSLPFGPLAPGANLEWMRDPAGPRALRSLVASSGGKEITELPEAWRSLDRLYYRSLRPYVMTLLVLAVLAEALATRVGVLTRWLPKRKEKPIAAAK